MGSLLLKNGRIVDGTGKPPYDGHLLVNGDKIAAIFKAGESIPPSDTVMDASGKIVCPGFIDMHSHSDWALPHDDHDIPLKCLPEQGVTTIVGGNCGFSPAPFTEKSRQLMAGEHFNLLIDKPLAFGWQTFGEFLDHLEKTRPIVNSAHLVGHASIRFAAADTRRGALPGNERARCQDLLQKALEAGACGMSFGLGYDPGMYSPLSELEDFCQAAKAAEKPVTVHLKALSRISPTYSPLYLKAHNIRALREMLEIARKTRIRLQISHLIFVGRRSWSTAEKSLKMIEAENRRGLDVMFDAFPYTFGNTTINAIFPYWFLSRLPAAYDSPWARARLRAELALGFRLVGFSFSDLQLMDAGAQEWADLNGMRVDELARHWRLSPFDAILKLSEVTGGNAVMLLHTYSGEPGNETVLDRVLTHEACLFETDALYRYGGYPNPAAKGAFPKLLGDYVRTRGLMSIETAVKRMTSASAARFNIKDRGVLEKGKAADMVVLDPDTVNESPPLDRNPAGRPRGICHVWINGTQVVRGGCYIDGVRAGQVLRC